MKRIEDIPQDLQMMFDLGITNPNPENVETMLSDMREAVLRSISEPAKQSLRHCVCRTWVGPTVSCGTTSTDRHPILECRTVSASSS
jgi:hypothetical protein